MFLFFFFLTCVQDQRKIPRIHFTSAVCICSFLKLVFPCSKLYGECYEESKHSPQHSEGDFCFTLYEWVLNSPHTGNSLWSVKEAGTTYLTGLLVRDTRRDSRQWNSFSSVMPERSSWTYSWDESVNSCLLFLRPPCKQKRTRIKLPWLYLQQMMMVWVKNTLLAL